MQFAFPNRVIVFGADHHNTLAALRCLGRAGCRLYTLVHLRHPEDDIRLFHSRYAKQHDTVLEDPTAVVAWLLAHREAGQKQILFPCSDFAAYTVDRHYAELADDYLIPGYQGRPGEVARMMDKYQQKQFADAHGIPMAKTWSLQREGETFAIPEDVVFPCILKPEISAAGKKSDIRVVECADALAPALAELAGKGYTTMLMQQFLTKQYEVDALGCITAQSPHHFGITLHKLREYPIRGGSTTFAKIVCIDAIDRRITQLWEALYHDGYRGMYNIELLVCADDVYLNEINYRQSGNGWAMIANGIPAPYLCCLDALGLPFGSQPQIAPGATFIDDVNDALSRHDYHCSLGQIAKDILQAKGRAVFAWFDLGGTWGYYRSMLGLFLRKFTRKCRRKSS